MAKSVLIIKSSILVDAIFDPVRSTAYIGSWAIASRLKQKGHSVRFMDEVFRDGGLDKRKLFERTIVGDVVEDKPLDISYSELQRKKMDDFKNLSSKEFSAKYSPYREAGKIQRTMVKVGNPLEETLSEVERTKPDFVGIPLIATANYQPAVELGKAIKQRWPEIKVIYGGQHISAKAKEFIEENPWVDHIILGDALKTFERVVDGTIKDKIIYSGFLKAERGKGPRSERLRRAQQKRYELGTQHGGLEPFDVDYREFPMLDPAIIAENGYPTETTYTYSTKGKRSVDYMTSTGCFKNCDFCLAPQFGTNVDPLPEEMIDAQLRIFKDAGYQELVIQDDAFLMPLKNPPEKPGWSKERLRIPRLRSVLGVMKKYGFSMQVNGGLDFQLLDKDVTDELIKYNKEGEGKITALYIPFNPRNWVGGRSATKVMLEKHPQNYENLKRLREEAGIYVYTTDIIGDPKEGKTVEMMEDDLKLHEQMLREGYVDQVLTLSATMLPGTEWEKNYGELVINPKDYAGYSLFTTHHRTKEVSDPMRLDEMLLQRNQELNKLQKSFPWGTAFPNGGKPGEVEREIKPENRPPSEIGGAMHRK